MSSKNLLAPSLILIVLMIVAATARHTGAQPAPCGTPNCVYVPVLLAQSALFPAPTKTPTNTATITPAGTPTNTATSTATNTPTSTATNTPTSTPGATPTNTPTATPTNSIYTNADMQVSVTWNRPGDFDLVVCTPNGKKIWKNNRGPDAGTDFHLMDRDDSSGTGPENIYSPTGTGVTGTYQIAGETPLFSPLPSAGNPVVAYFRIVVFGGTGNEQVYNLTTTYTSISSFPGQRIATLSYPAGTVSSADGPLIGCP